MYIRVETAGGRQGDLDQSPGGSLGQHSGGGYFSVVNGAINAAKRKMDSYTALFKRHSGAAGGARDLVAAAKDFTMFSKWSREHEFLKGLKAVYEPQTGVPLSYLDYPVTKTDAGGNKNKNLPWRQSPRRQPFDPEEKSGSFCLGAARAMAFRGIFGLDRPTNRQVLTELKRGIEEARASDTTSVEARLIISRLVSHLHDPGSMKQFNDDIGPRYGIQNAVLINATREQAFAALKQGAPVLADLRGGWHWVMLWRSPNGVLWANDPLGGVSRIDSAKLNTRFELIVDAHSLAPITPDRAAAYKR